MTPANDNLSAGAVYEIEFQLECMRRGHTVSVPICDNAGYDAIVDGRKGLSRVQVRGTTVFQTSRYQVGTGCGARKVNTKGDYDYLAVRAFLSIAFWSSEIWVFSRNSDSKFGNPASGETSEIWLP